MQDDIAVVKTGYQIKKVKLLAKLTQLKTKLTELKANRDKVIYEIVTIFKVRRHPFFILRIESPILSPDYYPRRVA